MNEKQKRVKEELDKIPFLKITKMSNIDEESDAWIIEFQLAYNTYGCICSNGKYSFEIEDDIQSKADVVWLQHLVDLIDTVSDKLEIIKGEVL